MNKNVPIEEILAVSKQLKLANVEYAFLGGAVIGIIIDNCPQDIRPTYDVDVTVDIVTKIEHSKLEKKLRSLGFSHDTTEGSPICRFKYDNIIVDIMPTKGGFLGLSSRWFPDALKHAQVKKCDGHEINVITAPYLIATKLEAFNGRGNNDFYASKDMEDIITVINGSNDIASLFESANRRLKKYIKNEFEKLLSSSGFIECVPAHLSNPRKETVDKIIVAINEIIDKCN